MATLTIRNVPEETKRALKARAAAHDRSMEAEVRDILATAVAPTDVNFGQAWLAVAERIRAMGGVELDIPEREAAPPPVVFD